jgi:hypothetical protein
LMEQQPIAGAKVMVAVILEELEEARQGFLRAHRHGRVADLYTEITTWLLLLKVLNRIAHACGEPGRAPWEPLPPVAEDSWSDEERAREMLRVGLDELRRAPEAWVTLCQILLEEQRVASRDKDNARESALGEGVSTHP